METSSRRHGVRFLEALEASGSDSERTPLTPTPAAMSEMLFQKVARRVIPLLWTGYVLNIIDRTNLAYAQLQMSTDLHLSARAFGYASGIFFLSYALMQVPTNHLISNPEIGAIRVLSTSMVLWGISATITGVVASEMQLIVLRFCLGMSESAFFPGVLLYLTRWIPDASSGRALAYFATAASVGGLLSAAGSGILLSVLDGVGGVRGWRWLLFVEGVPTIVLGLAAPMLLNERPQEAAWLSTTERAELVDALASTQLASVASGSAKGAPRRTLVHTLRETLLTTPCVLFCLTYIVSATIANSARFFLPTLLKEVYPSLPPWVLGLIFAVPAALKVVFSPITATWADAGGASRRFRWAWGAYAVAASLFVLAGLGMICLGGWQHGAADAGRTRVASSFLIGVVALADVLVQLAIPVFWSLHNSLQDASIRGCSIAVTNSIGNLGGFIGPWVLGAAHDAVGAAACGHQRHACTAQWGAGTLLLGGASLLILLPTAAAVRRRSTPSAPGDGEAGALLRPPSVPATMKECNE